MEKKFIRNNKVVRIDTKLYSEMYKVGGSILVAIYSELKAFRNSEERYIPIKHKSNNKVSTGYTLLSKCSGISKQTLQKYIPLLIDLDLCYFDSTNGALHIRGYKKTKKHKKGELIPVQIGKNLSETNLYVNYVILHSNLVNQGKMIKRKETLKVLLKLANSKNGKITKSQYKSIEKLRENGITQASDLKLVKSLILSNQGLARLFGSESKSKGYYLKRKMRSRGLFSTRRRFKDVLKRSVSFEEYLVWKFVAKSAGEDTSKITWRKGRVVEELCNEFISEDVPFSPLYILSSNKKKVYINI